MTTNRLLSGPRLLALALLFGVIAVALLVALSCAIAVAAQVPPAAPAASSAPPASAPAFIGALVAFAHIWIPIVVACALSIATGLSNYPAATGIVATIRRWVGVLSFLTFKDQPGTLKLPFTPHRKAASATTALVLIMALGLGLSVSACSWFKSTVEPIAGDVIDCVKAEGDVITSGKSVVEISLDIIGTVTAAIAEAGATDPLTAVEAAAKGLVVTYGQPIVACVEQKLAGALEGTPNAAAHAAYAAKFKFKASAK